MVERVPGQLGLQSETLSQNKNTKTKESSVLVNEIIGEVAPEVPCIGLKSNSAEPWARALSCTLPVNGVPCESPREERAYPSEGRLGFITAIIYLTSLCGGMLEQ